MSESRTVLEHLLDGRDALIQEVRRLTVAVDELDSVIARIGGSARRQSTADTVVETTARTAATAPVAPSARGSANSDPEVESSKPARKQPAKKTVAKSVAKRAPMKQAALSKVPARKSAAKAVEQPRSIRLHVLDMLAAEDREFGLSEIIDRIHGQGMQAHDDAVRSITIKLMKDGKVERVGRGQYRLARNDVIAAPEAEPASSDSATPAAEAPNDIASTDTSGPSGYTPPLNLGQPWSPAAD